MLTFADLASRNTWLGLSVKVIVGAVCQSDNDSCLGNSDVNYVKDRTLMPSLPKTSPQNILIISYVVLNHRKENLKKIKKINLTKLFQPFEPKIVSKVNLKS